MISKQQQELLRLVQDSSEQVGCTVYLVGGFVRDFLLGEPLEDLDIDLIVEGDLNALVEAVLSHVGGASKFFPKFLTAKIVEPVQFSSFREIDFAHARTEKYLNPGSLPEVYPATIKEDLYRRDFSVNAIAISLPGFLELAVEGKDDGATHGVFFDPFSGAIDLEEKVIRVMHPRSFIDDPTRIFRGLRYVTRIGATFEPETMLLMKQQLAEEGFQTISTFRIFTELRKVLLENCFAEIFEAMQGYGVLERALNISSEESQRILEVVVAFEKDEHSTGMQRYESLLVAYSRFLDPEAEKEFVKAIGIGKSRWQRLISEANSG